MAIEPWYWIVFTMAAAAAQTGRNAMQRELTAVLGTAGATQVRFLYGLPFAALFLWIVLSLTGRPLPEIGWVGILWTAVGAAGQVLATGLMLAAMKEKSFVVTIAMIKVEPVWVALFALAFLGEALGGMLLGGIAVATLGVLVMSWPARGSDWAARPIALGIGSSAMFAVATIGYRGAMLTVSEPHFAVVATTVLVLGLLMQVLMLVGWMLCFDRPMLIGVLRVWRPSMFTGLLAALSSQAWFLAFAVENPARVRTLGLVEIVFAQLISRRIFSQSLGRGEAIGMVLLVGGVAAVLLS